jgi:hypothetical protein
VEAAHPVGRHRLEELLRGVVLAVDVRHRPPFAVETDVEVREKSRDAAHRLRRHAQHLCRGEAAEAAAARCRAAC